jgi:hypothetical protein
MQSQKMPNRKSELVKVSQQRRKALLGAATATLIIGLGGVGAWHFLQGKPGNLDTSNGVNLLPADTLMSVAISTNPEQWQQFQEFGVPESRGVFTQQLSQLERDFLTNYGYEYQRDIQPWIGKQILIGYLSDRGSKGAKNNSIKLPQQRMLMLMPIAQPDLAKQSIARYQPPADANLVESDYQGFTIQEIKRKTGTIATAIVDNFVVIGTDRPAVEKAIDAQRTGNSIVKTPGYTKALSEITFDRPFAQIYVNIPLATAMAAINSPKNLPIDRLVETQDQQGIAANAILEKEGIRWQGISWLKPKTRQKLVVENNSKNIAKILPDHTLVMISGGNLQQLWKDYLASSTNNPIASFTPNDISKNLASFTSLDLESEILNWSKGEYGAAIVPKSNPSDTEMGAALVLLQQVSDRGAAEKSLKNLDNTMNKKHGFKIETSNLGGKEIINWSSPLGGVGASHGWLDHNLAFLTMGAPVVNTFVPQPQTRLVDHPLFQQATRSRLNPHNGQFFIDVDRTINAGNLPLPKLPTEVTTLFKGIRNIGITSAVVDEYTNRFDLFINLKKVPGVIPPTPAPSKNPVQSPSPKASQ